MTFIVIIPARYGSRRLPGKPLLDLQGKTLIQRVFEKAKSSKAGKVYIATDHQKILDCCNGFGATSVLTSSEHLTGTDRIAEAVTKLNIKDDSVIVNLQGDEPFIDPRDVNNVAKFIKDRTNFDMGTLFSELQTQDEDNQNIVKIWVDQNDKAKGFSRKKNLIQAKGLVKRRHLGIYSYRADFIKKFVSWDQTKNEISESLEQLRVLENNGSIGAIEALSKSQLGIDTEEDLIKARSIISNE